MEYANQHPSLYKEEFDVLKGHGNSHVHDHIKGLVVILVHNWNIPTLVFSAQNWKLTSSTRVTNWISERI